MFDFVPASLFLCTWVSSSIREGVGLNDYPKDLSCPKISEPSKLQGMRELARRQNRIFILASHDLGPVTVMYFPKPVS